MKILHMCLCGPFTDNWSYQDNLLPIALHNLGVENTILALMSDYDNKYVDEKNTIIYKLNNVKIIRIMPTKSKIKSFFYYYNVYDFICNEKPDYIFVHCVQTCAALSAIKYKNKINKDCVIVSDNHANFKNSPIKKDLIHTILYSIRNKIIKKCAKNYSVVWGITPECCDYINSVFKIPKNKIDLLPLGHNISNNTFEYYKKNRNIIREKYNFSNTDIVLITGGKIGKDKKICELIEALKFLNNRDVYLFVFGKIDSNYEKDINNKLKKFPFKENIIFLGQLSVEEYSQFFVSSDIAIFPGGQSVIWQQAIGCGLPLIVDKNQNVEYLNVCNNVYFSDGNSPQSLSIAIKDCINNYFRDMTISATNYGRDYFSYERIAQIVVKKYEEVKNENQSC